MKLMNIQQGQIYGQIRFYNIKRALMMVSLEI